MRTFTRFRGVLLASLFAITGMSCLGGSPNSEGDSDPRRNIEGGFGEDRLVFIGVTFDYAECISDIQESMSFLKRSGIAAEGWDTSVGISDILVPKKDAQRATQILQARCKNSNRLWFKSTDEWCADSAKWEIFSRALSSGKRHLRRNNLSTAVAYLSLAIQLLPESLEGTGRRGQACEAYGLRAAGREQRGEVDDAIRDYEMAAELDPGGGTPYYAALQRLKKSGQSDAEWSLVAHYPGTDRPTGSRILGLLKVKGIEAVSYGSLGYSVSVPAGDAARAREILRRAIRLEGLQAGIFEETDYPRDPTVETVDVDNPEYKSWNSFPEGSWRRFRVNSPSGVREYVDRLRESTPSGAVLERESAGERWTVRVFPRIGRLIPAEIERREGDEGVLVGTEWISCRRIHRGPEGAWEKTWSSTKVPGGWAKVQRKDLGTILVEELVLDYAAAK
jgi:hypothetical protein